MRPRVTCGHDSGHETFDFDQQQEVTGPTSFHRENDRKVIIEDKQTEPCDGSARSNAPMASTCKSSVQNVDIFLIEPLPYQDGAPGMRLQAIGQYCQVVRDV